MDAQCQIDFLWNIRGRECRQLQSMISKPSFHIYILRKGVKISLVQGTHWVASTMSVFYESIRLSNPIENVLRRMNCLYVGAVCFPHDHHVQATFPTGSYLPALHRLRMIIPPIQNRSSDLVLLHAFRRNIGIGIGMP